MFNFSVVINGVTFTQDDFEGLEYLDGIPDTLEAMADETLTTSSLPWPTSNTSFDPSFTPPFTITQILSITNAPHYPIEVGDLVLVTSGYQNYMGAVVTATAPNSITVEGIHSSVMSAPSSSWTIIRTRAHCRPVAMRLLGHGELGSNVLSRSGLLAGPSNTHIRMSSTDICTLMDHTAPGTYPLGKGWKVTTTSNIGQPFDYQCRATATGGLSVTPEARGVWSFHNSGVLTPFLYGAMVSEIYAEGAEGTSGLVNPTGGVWTTPTHVFVHLPGVSQSWVKLHPYKTVRLVYSPHLQELEIWNGGDLIDSVNIPDPSVRLTCKMESKPLHDRMTYVSLHYSQQTWR